MCLAAASSDEIARLRILMGWKADQMLANVGAGEGEFGIAAAAVLGETGKVYLTESDEKKRKKVVPEAKRSRSEWASRPPS